MKCDPQKLKVLREKKGITQEKLAHDSRTGLRTIQRAERGQSIRNETVAFIAEALSVPIAHLRADEGADLNDSDPKHDVIILRRMQSGSVLIDILHKSYMCRLECDVDADGSNVATLKGLVELLEARTPDPLTWTGNHRFASLADRLDTVASLNDYLHQLDELDIGVFAGSYMEKIQKPMVSPYEPPEVMPGTIPTPAILTRVVISDGSREKLAVQRDYRWPITIWDDDLDDDVPF